MTARAARQGMLLVLGVYLLVGGAYSVLAPLGEAPDELAHFRYLRHVVEERRLPRTAADRQAAGLKGHEPPLYYALAGLATAWVDTGSLPQLKTLDPDRHPRHSLPDEVLIDFSPLHTADERWPYRGAVLAWHLARLGSLALMAATLAVLFQVVRQVCPKHPQLALLATAAAALTPQFVYIGSSVNNDALAALLGAGVLWALLRLAHGDVRWRQFLLLGLLLGLGRLAKFYMLALLPVAALALLVLAWRRRQWRYGAGLVLALSLSFVIPLPWLLHIQPADPGLTRGVGRLLVLLDVVHAERWFTAGGEGQAGGGILAVVRALGDGLQLQPGRWGVLLFQSYWGYFGAMTVQAPSLVYALAAALSGLSLLGWLRLAVDRLRGRATVLDACRHLWIPALAALAFLGTEAVFYGVMKRLPDTAQARHLYPALGGLALCLALGWWGLWRPPASVPATAGVVALLLALCGYCLPSVLLTAHKPLLPVRSTPWPDAPAGQESLSLGDGLVLEGQRWSASAPGQVTGTLFWKATEPPAGEAVAILELVGSGGSVDAVWAGHPGGSRYPTQAWDAGDHVRQELRWPLPAPIEPGQRTVRLRLLREGRQAVDLDLATVDLPAAPAEAPRPACRVYGPEQAGAQLRDTVLITWPGARLEGLAGPRGLAWEPLARTARGDQVALVVGPGVQPGRYAVRAEGQVPASAEPCEVTVEGRWRSFDLPPGLQPVGAVLGETIELAGYALESGRTAPGQAVRLRLAWRARGRIGAHYTVFTHLIDEQGRVWGQHDKLPGEGYSTLFWAPGEVVVDDYTLQVDPDVPPGAYRLVAGLYQGLSGVRAPVRDAAGQSLGGQVVLAQVEVAPE